MNAIFFPLSRRRFVAAAGAVGAASVLMRASDTSAADFPSKAVTLVTISGPGGPLDVVARLMAEQLQKSWGQTVIVENRPGAAGLIGTQYLAKAPPDGYTLLLTTGSFVITPLLNRSADYDPVNGFTPISKLAFIPTVWAARSSLGANTMQDVIKLARANPGKISFGSAGIGSTHHIYLEVISDFAKVKFLHVPYKSVTAGYGDLLDGRLDVHIMDAVTYRNLALTGKVHGLAVNGNTRIPSIPEVPTFKESGIPGLEITGWVGIFAPPRTPASVAKKLSSQIGFLLEQPAIRDKLLDNMGAVAQNSSPEEFKQRLQYEFDFYGALLKKFNIPMN